MTCDERYEIAMTLDELERQIKKLRQDCQTLTDYIRTLKDILGENYESKLTAKELFLRNN